MKTAARQKHNQSLENLIRIAVDGRVDKDTLLYEEFVKENRPKTMKKAKGPERHLTFTKETPYETKYLTHRVIPNICATGAVHAEQVVDVLHEFNNENTIKAILVDNTNANTGREGGMAAILEKKIFTQLVPLCTVNELLFRAL